MFNDALIVSGHQRCKLYSGTARPTKLSSLTLWRRLSDFMSVVNSVWVVAPAGSFDAHCNVLRCHRVLSICCSSVNVITTCNSASLQLFCVALFFQPNFIDDLTALNCCFRHDLHSAQCSLFMPCSHALWISDCSKQSSQTVSCDMSLSFIVCCLRHAAQLSARLYVDLVIGIIW